MKKLFAVMLVCGMVLSFAAVVFAEEKAAPAAAPTEAAAPAAVAPAAPAEAAAPAPSSEKK